MRLRGIKPGILVSLLLISGMVPGTFSGTTVASAGFETQNLQPQVAPDVEVSPSSGALNGGYTVVVTVSAVPANPIVTFGGVPATVLSIQATTLSATVPPSGSLSEGSVLVEVGDGSTTVSANAFSYDAPPNRVFNNGKLRFGGGDGRGTAFSEADFDPTVDSILVNRGVLTQPFYKSSNGNWYQLTYSNYPLNVALGAGSSGSNWTGATVSLDPTLTSFVTDYSGFVPTGFADVTNSAALKGHGVIAAQGEVALDGISTRLTQTYELTSTSAFVKVITKLTNLSSTDTLTNPNLWVGTRDDYVGSSDGPTKEKGNLTTGSFVSISAQSDTARALQITSGNEGVLFYSTTLGTGIALHPNLGFQNPVDRDPALSPVTMTGDDSYALHVPFPDIPAGGSQEVIWFYAAGEIAALADVVQEVVQAAPPVQAPSPPATNPAVLPPIVTFPADDVPSGGSSTTSIPVTRPTIPGSSVPSAPVTSLPGSLPEVAAGESLVTENGELVPVVLESTSESGWRLSGSGFAMTLEVPAGGSVPGAPAGGVVTLVQSKTVEVGGSGFLPGSIVDVWLFSEPRFLGSVLVNADGTFEGNLTLPVEVPVGLHTLQANGVTSDQKVRSLNLGVRVTAEIPTLPITGKPFGFLPAVSVVVVVLGLGVMYLSRRRVVRLPD